MSGPASLDAAWAEAEAALPEGHYELRLSSHAGVRGVYFASVHDGTEGAMATRAGVAVAEGPTPAAALRALAEKLGEETP